MILPSVDPSLWRAELERVSHLLKSRNLDYSDSYLNRIDNLQSYKGGKTRNVIQYFQDSLNIVSLCSR